jgi:hypothetical protein
MSRASSTLGGEERVLVENLRERDHLEDPNTCGIIILARFFRKRDVEAWTESSWFRIGTGVRHL